MTNKPSMTLLEFAQHCVEQLYAETNYKGVLRRQVELFHQWIGLESAVYFTLDTVMQNSESKRSVVKFPPVDSFKDDTTSSLRAALQSVVSGELEVKHGVYLFQVMGVDYFCAEFDEPNSRRGVLVWTILKNKLAPEIQNQLALNHESLEQLMQIIVRGAQQAAFWLRKIDNTQALLYQDEVTGLFNYRYLDVAIDGEIKRLQRFYAPFSLLFIDLDNFKSVNDQFGHLTGSEVLRQVGHEIKYAVRDVDSVIRYGGDEFVVVLIGAATQQAAHAAERVRSRIDRHSFTSPYASQKLHLTASIGVACCPDHAQDKATMIRLADETMYEAKKLGKNRVVMMSKPPSPQDNHDHWETV